MDALEEAGKGDPLAQPTRAKIFASLGQLKRPARVEELARKLKLHPNSVRLHLERLEQAGLARRAQVGSGMGRPHFEWSIEPGARPAGRRPRAYADLARWLTRAMDGVPAAERRIERTGKEIGHELAPEPGKRDPLAVLDSTLAALGFEPERKNAQGSSCYRFWNCPYAAAATANPSVVCTLHRGMAQGLVDALVPQSELLRFEPRDPARAGCLMELGGIR